MLKIFAVYVKIKITIKKKKRNKILMEFLITNRQLNFCFFIHISFIRHNNSTKNSSNIHHIWLGIYRVEELL